MIADVVVVSYNSAKDLRSCLDSILASGATAIVVDSGSTDEKLGILEREYPTVQVYDNPQNGYARAANIGFRKSTSAFVILSNADVVYPAGSISRLTGYLEANADIGVLGPQQTYPDGSWQRSWGAATGMGEALLELSGATSLYNGFRRMLWPLRINRKVLNVGYVDGAVMAIRRPAFEAIQGFDPSFPFSAEETDFCIRARQAGWRVVALPSVDVIHRRGGSTTLLNWSVERKTASLVDGTRRLLRKYHGRSFSNIYFAIKRLFNLYMLMLCKLGVRAAPRSARVGLTEKIRIHRAYCVHLRSEPDAVAPTGIAVKTQQVQERGK